MRQFIGKVFTLIAGLLLIILSLIGGGFVLYDLCTYKLSILTETVFFYGWIALLSTVFFLIVNFIIAFMSLRNISLNISNKKILIANLVLIPLYIIYMIYIFCVIKEFDDLNLFINTSIFVILGYISLSFGIYFDNF